jgi:hypothetical protein
MAGMALGRKTEFVAAAFLLAMTIGHVVMFISLVPSLRSGYQDFTIFYTAGRLLHNGPASKLYDLGAQYQLQREFAPHVYIRRGPLPYNHPPFEALLFLPFGYLEFWPAYLLWTALNLGMLAISLALLRREFEQIRWLSPATVVLAATGFFPIAIAMIQGQDAVLLLLICVLALVSLARQRDVAAGAILAVGLFKFHLIIPLLLLLAIRRWRILVGFLPVAVALAAISVAMLGWHGPADYVHFVLQLEKSGAGAGIGTYEMPNLRGLISYLPGFTANGAPTILLTLAASLAIFMIALHRIKAGRDFIGHSFALAAVTAILVSYHAFAYDLCLLLPGAFFMFSGITEAQGESPKHSLLLALLFLTPLYVLLGFRLSRFCWFAVVVILLFAVLARSQTARPERSEVV